MFGFPNKIKSLVCVYSGYDVDLPGTEVWLTQTAFDRLCY